MNTERCNDHTDQSLVRELLIWQTCPGHFLIQLLHHWPTHSRSESTMQCNAEISLRVPLDCPAAHQRAAAQARREIVTGWSWALTPLTQGWSWALTSLTQGWSWALTPLTQVWSHPPGSFLLLYLLLSLNHKSSLIAMEKCRH